MENSKNIIPSITSILKKLSDDRALTLFNSIAVSNGERYMPVREMNLSTKQYYFRISGLLNGGLIKRYKGRYSLTLFGRVIYIAHTTIGKALSYYWQIKAIESVEKSLSGDELRKVELTELITTLIDNHQIKDILIKAISESTSESRAFRAASKPTWSKEEDRSCKS